MRITHQQLHMNSLLAMQRTNADLAETMQKMSTGKAILKPSDDPVGVVKLNLVKQDSEATSQYQDNIQQLSDRLSRTETSLDSMNNLMLRMTELTTSAGNSTHTDSSRKALAAELRQLQDALVDDANAKDHNGKYLFSGNNTDTATIGTNAGTGQFEFQGGSQGRQVPIAESSTMEANVTGDSLFGANADLLNQLSAYIDALEDPAMTPGSTATDGNGNTFDDLQDQMTSILDQTMDTVTMAMSDLGGKQNTLDQVSAHHQDMMLFNQKVIDDTEALDYAEAMTTYSSQMTTLQATQQTYAKIASLSLFDLI